MSTFRLVFAQIMVALVCVAQGHAAPADAQRIYDSLDVAEWYLIFRNPQTGEPRVGSHVLEKSVDGLMCRRISAVVPNPVYRYTCYVRLNISNLDAKRKYHALGGRSFDVSYTEPQSGRPRLGTTVREKSGRHVICQRIAAVVPNPVPWYHCYRDMNSIR